VAVRIDRHQTLEVVDVRPGAPDRPAIAHYHASLWLAVDLSTWGERRQGHLRLVRPVGAPGWRRIDLGRHPMRAVSGRPDEVDIDRLTAELATELARRPLRFHRIPELGAVSEFGEDEAEFRRRVLRVLRPALQRQADRRGEGGTPRRPLRRHRQRDHGTNELASRIAQLVESMETYGSPDPWTAVERVEIGVLLIPDGLDLAPSHPRDLMIGGASPHG
jgi:hypothetical protein